MDHRICEDLQHVDNLHHTHVRKELERQEGRRERDLHPID